MEKQENASQFAVLGLGRFGMSIVETLSEYDVNVLACDSDPALVHSAMEYATHVVQMDVTDETDMQNLGLGNFDVVILAMGEDFEAALMATMLAKEQGAQFIMVKAKDYRRKKILESIGADQVVLPECEMGAKIARKMVGSNILDILEESEHYSISEMHPQDDWVGKTVRESDIRRNHGLTILAVRQGEDLHIPVSPDQILGKNDILITLTEKNH